MKEAHKHSCHIRDLNSWLRWAHGLPHIIKYTNMIITALWDMMPCSLFTDVFEERAASIFRVRWIQVPV
jgi:hypothetical protein